MIYKPHVTKIKARVTEHPNMSQDERRGVAGHKSADSAAKAGRQWVDTSELEREDDLAAKQLQPLHFLLV